MSDKDSMYALRVKQVVYDAVARLLPVMGKDFLIDVGVDGRDGARAKVSVIVTPLTPLGKAIVPTLREMLPEEMAKVGRKPHGR